MNRRELIKAAMLASGSIGIGGLRSLVREFHGLDSSPFNLSSGQTDWEDVRSQFRFADDMIYMNNASLGASPMSVRDATHVFRDLLDEYPSKFMWGGWKDEKEAVRTSMAQLLNAEADDIALTHNTTEGMNIIAASLDLEEGDEVIVGNHEHPTARIPWKYHQEERRGAVIVRPDLPLTPTVVEELVEVYRAAITDKTRVISMVHVTNTNGMILPVKEICAMAKERGIITAVDGAQSLGAMPVDVKDIGCDYYAASCHKWLFSPKGMGVLYASADATELRPMIANRRYKSPSMRRVEDYNTRNLPELLGVGTSIDFHNALGTEVMSSRMRELRDYFYQSVIENDKIKWHTPVSNELSLHIAAVEVEGKTASELKSFVSDEFNIDTRWMGSHGMNGIRVSLSVYNNEQDIDLLVSALSEASVSD